jgi:methyl-accepting chemotaxis protein
VENINRLVSSSSESVSKGNELIGQVEEVLSGIIDSVESVSDHVTNMATSFSEQSAGVFEISNTVEALDKNTQNNAALAEELSASSHVLNEQCKTTMDEVRKFSVCTADRRTDTIVIGSAA